MTSGRTPGSLERACQMMEAMVRNVPMTRGAIQALAAAGELPPLGAAYSLLFRHCGGRERDACVWAHAIVQHQGGDNVGVVNRLMEDVCMGALGRGISLQTTEDHQLARELVMEVYRQAILMDGGDRLPWARYLIHACQNMFGAALGLLDVGVCDPRGPLHGLGLALHAGVSGNTPHPEGAFQELTGRLMQMGNGVPGFVEDARRVLGEVQPPVAWAGSSNISPAFTVAWSVVMNRALPDCTNTGPKPRM